MIADRAHVSRCVRLRRVHYMYHIRMSILIIADRSRWWWWWRRRWRRRRRGRVVCRCDIVLGVAMRDAILEIDKVGVADVIKLWPSRRAILQWSVVMLMEQTRRCRDDKSGHVVGGTERRGGRSRCGSKERDEGNSQAANAEGPLTARAVRPVQVASVPRSMPPTLINRSRALSPSRISR